MHKKYLAISILCLFILLDINFSYGHSGRTDSSGGHRDNNNVSGLGYYHYHHGQGPHLHDNGICPYSVSTSTISDSVYDEEKSSKVWIYSLAGAGILGYFLSSKARERKYIAERELMQERLRKEIEQQFLEEKQKYTLLYGGKSPQDIANVPNGILFDQNNKPIKGQANDFKWGSDFTVFVSKSGSSYHKKKGCSGADIDKHIFDVYNRKSPCKKCVNHSEFSIPSWYFEYKRIKEVKEKYKIV